MSKNTNDIFGQVSNSSVTVENRAIGVKDLLCDDGTHPDADGICADGSHPLVTHANPVPVNKSLNEMNNSLTNSTPLCPDGSVANSTTAECHDGFAPQQLSIDNLTCTDGYRPIPNGTCGDVSLPLLGNKTKTAISGK